MAAATELGSKMVASVFEMFAYQTSTASLCGGGFFFGQEWLVNPSAFVPNLDCVVGVVRVSVPKT